MDDLRSVCTASQYWNTRNFKPNYTQDRHKVTNVSPTLVKHRLYLPNKYCLSPDANGFVGVVATQKMAARFRDVSLSRVIAPSRQDVVFTRLICHQRSRTVKWGTLDIFYRSYWWHLFHFISFHVMLTPAEALPGKRETIIQCRLNVGSASATLAQHYISTEWTFHILWVIELRNWPWLKS